MKHTLVFAALGLTAIGVAAQEVGHVVSSTPIVQQVAVPRQVCHNQPMLVQQQPSGAGGIIGALAGAAIGSQFGGGSGRGAAMVAGTLGGALLGNSVEAQGSQHVQNVAQCSTQTSYENRTVAWNVTYDYAGRRHNVQMPYDPGPTIRLNVSPVGASDYRQPEMGQGGQYGSAVAQYGGAVVVAPPVQVQPEVQGYIQSQPAYVQQAQVAIPVAPAPIVYSQYPVYPAYSAYPAYPAYPVYRAYPPIGISLGLGFGFGGHHHRRR
jgi:uncharacterized protein YcfJ